MLIEVHTGAKPGRPRRLLVLSAGLLAGTLGLAWLQVREAHALGPEQRVGDTPLRVRVPKDWRPYPDDPQRFILPVVSERRHRLVLEFERSVRFELLALPAFQPIESLLQFLDLDDQRTLATRRQARIGPYPALEVRHLVPLRLGRRVVERETIVRFTCLPRGHLLQVTYDPLIELRPADFEIMEEVCDSLRIDDPTLSGDAAEFMRSAGLEFALEDDWLVVGTHFEEVPGLYVGGTVNGLPAWSIAILRTWLAAGRRPRDLLADLAGREWLLWDTDALLSKQRRPDGAAVATLRHPEFGHTDERIQSAMVVAEAAAEAVIMFVYAGPGEAEVADEVARRLAAEIEIAALDAIPEVDRAEEAGRVLTATLAARGPVPRWGREPVQTVYRGSRLGRTERLTVRREAVRRNPELGYSGTLRRRTGRRQREETIQWTVDGHAQSYRWQADLYNGRNQLAIIEQRAKPSDPVRRQIIIDERERHARSFQPGPGFVPPPVESIIEGWVARGEVTAAIVETSSILGLGTHTVLLRSLPPDDGFPRVLVQSDFWPQGAILAFDDARAETHYELYPSATYWRERP